MCKLGDTITSVPVHALHDKEALMGAFCLEAWKSLTDVERESLRTLLPLHTDLTEEELLGKLFDPSENFLFGIYHGVSALTPL